MKEINDKVPSVIRIFSFLIFCGVIGNIILGIKELINLSFMNGLLYFIVSIFLFVIFIGLIKEKKWSIYLLIILFSSYLIYNIWILFNKSITKYDYIFIGIGALIFIVIIYLLKMENVKEYFN